MPFVPEDDPIGPDIYEAVGFAIAMWAEVEQLLSLSLVYLALEKPAKQGDKDRVLMLTHGKEVRAMLGLARALVHKRFPKDAKRFDKLAEHIEDLYTKRRNVLAHYAIRPGTKPGTATLSTWRTTRRLSKLEHHPVTADTIRRWAASFATAGKRLVGFMNEHDLFEERWREEPE